MSDIHAMSDEVAGLSARIAATHELPFAHLAPRYTALAIHALETQLVENEKTEKGIQATKVPHELVLLRKIAETRSRVELLSAVENGDVLLVKLLIESNAEPAANKNAAFQFAIENGQTEIVRLLLEVLLEPAADNNAALRVAIIKGHTEIVRMLLELPLERGVNPAEGENDDMQVSMLHHACHQGHTEIVRMLLELPLERGVNPAAHDNYGFQIACDKGHVDIARLLLDLPEERGVDPSYDDNAVLRVSCNKACKEKGSEIELLKVLLAVPEERGVDAEIRNEMLNFVCELGNVEIARLFIDHPSNRLLLDLNSAFQYACSNEYVEIVHLLLDVPGVDPAADNNAALTYACEEGKFGFVCILLDLPAECGVNLKHFDDDQLYEISKNYPSISARLLRHMISHG